MIKLSYINIVLIHTVHVYIILNKAFICIREAPRVYRYMGGRLHFDYWFLKGLKICSIVAPYKEQSGAIWEYFTAKFKAVWLMF